MSSSRAANAMLPAVDSVQQASGRRPPRECAAAGDTRSGDTRHAPRGSCGWRPVPSPRPAFRGCSRPRGPDHAASSRSRSASPASASGAGPGGPGSVAAIASRDDGSSYGQSLAVRASPRVRSIRRRSSADPSGQGSLDCRLDGRDVAAGLPALVELSFEEVARVEDVVHRVCPLLQAESRWMNSCEITTCRRGPA